MERRKRCRRCPERRIEGQEQELRYGLMLPGRDGQNLDVAVREFEQPVTPVRQCEVLRFGPESLERGRVGHRTAVGCDHTQSVALEGSVRHVPACLCS